MLFLEDLRQKAQWRYGSSHWKTLLKTAVADGTAAMFWYRLMQWSQHRRLTPLTMLFNKINALFCQCIIGRGAEFGPGFVLNHSQGIVINSGVRGGSRVFLEHQVTLGAEKNESPVLGDDVYVGAGAKIIGAVRVGTQTRVGANAVVVRDVPDGATVGGIPARILKQRPVEQPAATGNTVDDTRLNDTALDVIGMNDVTLNDTGLNDITLNDNGLNDNGLNDNGLSDTETLLLDDVADVLQKTEVLRTRPVLSKTELLVAALETTGSRPAGAESTGAREGVSVP